MRISEDIVVAGVCASFCLFGLVSAAEPVRPYEMVRAGRTADDVRPLLPLTDAEGWTVETRDAAASVTTATDRAVFGTGCMRLVYRGTGDRPFVWLHPPHPVRLQPGCDTISLWVYGNNALGNPKDTPSVCLNILLRDARGAELTPQFATVHHHGWFKIVSRFPTNVIERIRDGGELVGLLVHRGTNRDDRSIDLTSLCLYREELGVLSFAPRAKRGVRIFPEAPQGVNTGTGRLPFPTVETTIIPVCEPDRTLEFRLPDDPCDWDALAFRKDDGDWVRFAVGGGIYPKAARKGAMVRFQRIGNSLVADVIRKGGSAEDVRFGGVEAPDHAERVVMPYLTYGFEGPSNRPAVVSFVMAGKPFFLSAHFDWTQSNASEPLACDASDGGLVAANGGVRYVPKTDGVRNDVYERFVWTFSREFADVLPVIPNPVSPWKSVTGSHLWIESSSSTNRESDFAVWRTVRRNGMRRIIVNDWETMWRDGYESFTFRTDPAPRKGGDAGQHRYTRRMIDELGFRYGPYNNFTDLATVNEHWSPDRVSRCPDGRLQGAWYRCYSPKPLYAVEMCECLTPLIQEKFAFNTAYCDVHTATSPWKRTDYDARVPGAGTFAQTFYAYGEIMLLQKKTWNGPVYSEGNMHWLYSGLTDGNYAHDRGYRIVEMPWLVDFDLRRIHPLECNVGMGAPTHFYFGHEPEDRVAGLDRFLTATVAFGHPGHFIRWGNGEDLQSYFMIQAIAAKYTQADVRDIRYGDADGNLVRTSEAVANGAFRRSQVVVRYSDGTFVAANGSTNETFRIAFGNRSMTLPPNGFFAANGEVRSFSGTKDGHRADIAVAPDYVYVNGRGTFTRFAEGGTDGRLLRLKREDGEDLLADCATVIELPYVAERIVEVGFSGKGSVPVAFEVSDGRTTFRPGTRRRYYWVNPSVK